MIDDRLSGTHPFAGDDDEEIYNNVCYVRYRSAELYRGLSVEATRLIMETLKVLPEWVFIQQTDDKVILITVL